MKIQRFKVSNAPHLAITCHGDLDISGGREGEVAIKAYGAEEDLVVERQGERLNITAHSRCKVGCPRDTSLTLEAVHGDLRLRRVNGPVAIETVQGDASFKEVGPTTARAIQGDVRARLVRGELRLEQVAGDLTARGVEGVLASESVGGDVNGAYLEGGLQATAGGDAVLKTDFVAGHDYRVDSGGDVSIKFPAQASARIQVHAQGDIRHKVDWAEIRHDADTLEGRVGEGEASVEIHAGGDVVLRGRSDAEPFVMGFAPDEDLGIELDSMAEEIERSIEAHMARWQTQLETKLGRLDQDAVRDKIERIAEKVRRKAERQAERARLKAERAQRRWERMGGQRPSRPPRAPTPPAAPAADPVGEEERMMVLRMVQENKITADEAAQLLEAMEG